MACVVLLLVTAGAVSWPARAGTLNRRVYLPVVSRLPELPPPPPPTTVPEDSPERQMLDAINSARADNGLSPLAPAPCLYTSSERHAVDMAVNLLTVTHTGSDGTSAGDRITAAGYAWSTYGEAVGGSSDYGVQMILNAFMASPPHRALLLSGTLRDVGIGYERSPLNGWSYWTIDLGLPR
jgi:uncharacterized protein YkwD